MGFKDLIEIVDYKRKLMHFFMGISFVYVMHSEIDFIKYKLELIMAALLLFTLALSLIAKSLRPKPLMDILKHFDKPEDLKVFPAKGAVYYLIGALITILLFDRDIASASILILAVGDPLAHVFGMYYGKTKLLINDKKVLEGTLAGTFFATIAASFIVPFPISFFGAAFGMIAEAFELEFLNLDDNFFIPVVAGFVMQWVTVLL